MANSYTLLANLRAGRCSNTAEVRLLRFWEARNINKEGELMSIEMLLIDEAVSVLPRFYMLKIQSFFLFFFTDFHDSALFWKKI
ncbi:BnaUnng04540D [Brassica napus]|uniref:BnaUnng04540D protein n=1 Tax=Brassica napus TaxID=3708 RepID=A0A078JZ87_BRANA|nr:BnaUnng04540D [Brassica napus]